MELLTDILETLPELKHDQGLKSLTTVQQHMIQAAHVQ